MLRSSRLPLGRRSRLARPLLALVLAPALVGTLLGATELALALLGMAPRPTNFVVQREENGREFHVFSGSPPEPTTQFRTPRFAVRPESGVRRLVCLGGSSTAGHPFAMPVAFANWLDTRLPHLLPDQRFEVLNLGANGWHSELVADLVEELDGAAADVLVLYCGHNEFLLRNLTAFMQPVRARLYRWLKGTRLGRLALGGFALQVSDELGARARGERIGAQPLLTPAQEERAYASYERNLRRILELARARGAAVVLCRPVSDVRDTPVYRSHFTAPLSMQQRAAYCEELVGITGRRQALERLVAEQPGRSVEAPVNHLLQRLAALVEQDASVADLAYERGRCLLLLGRPEPALELLESARERDGHPLRATTRIGAILARLAAEFGVTFVDPEPLFRREAPDGIPGRNGLFVDHCHPDLRGHELLAEALLQAMARDGVLAAPPAWRFDLEPALEEYRAGQSFDTRSQAVTLAQWSLFTLQQASYTANEGGVHGARMYLERALALDENCGLAHAGLAIIAAILGDAGRARELLAEAIRRDPEAMREYLPRIARREVVRELFRKVGLDLEAEVRRLLEP